MGVCQDFQISFFLKPTGGLNSWDWSQISYGASMGWLNESLFNWSRSHDQYSRNSHGKNLKKSSSPESKGRWPRKSLSLKIDLQFAAINTFQTLWFHFIKSYNTNKLCGNQSDKEFLLFEGVTNIKHARLKSGVICQSLRIMWWHMPVVIYDAASHLCLSVLCKDKILELMTYSRKFNSSVVRGN